MASGSENLQPSSEVMTSSSTESTLVWTPPSTVYTPPSDEGEWPTLKAPNEVLVGEPFTVTGVCTYLRTFDLLDVLVGYGDFTEPNWNSARIFAPNEPWPSSFTNVIDANGAFSLGFTGVSAPATLYIGVACGMDICSDIVGLPSCSLFPPQAVVEVHIVTAYSIPPTR